MLDEELIDLMTFCLQNPDSTDVPEKHNVYGNSKEKISIATHRWCPKCHQYVDSNQYNTLK